MTNPQPFGGRVVSLDGGTSTTRARLIENDGIIAEARRPVGVRDAVLSPGTSPVEHAVRACLAELEAAFMGMRFVPIVAAGMLSSEVGLATVPHALAPAGVVELGRGAVSRVVSTVSDQPILFVPGVRTPHEEGPDGWVRADLMRGEECETLGALLALDLPGPVVMIWPGSHTKLVEVDSEGRIARSYTTLAGEVLAALAGHTLIAKSLPEALPEEPDADSVALGLRLGAEQGVGRAAFLVRIADVTDSLDPHRRASFWIAAVIGDDVAHLARHSILRDDPPIWVGGREPQRSIYAAGLRLVGKSHVSMINDDLAARASAIGAVAVAREAGGRA